MIGSKPFSNSNNWLVTNNIYSMYSACRVSHQDGGLWFVVCLLITCFSNSVLYFAGRVWWLIEASQMHVLWCVFVERRPIGSLSASVFCRRRTALWQTLSRSNSAAPSQCRCRVSGIVVASRRRNGPVSVRIFITISATDLFARSIEYRLSSSSNCLPINCTAGPAGKLYSAWNADILPSSTIMAETQIHELSAENV